MRRRRGGGGGALTHVIDVAVRAATTDLSDDMGAGLHRARVRLVERWVRRALWAVAVFMGLYFLRYAGGLLLSGDGSVYQRMLRKENVVMLDVERSTLKQYAGAVDSLDDTQLRAACAHLTDTGHSDTAQAAPDSARRVQITNVLRTLQAHARRMPDANFLAPKFFDHVDDAGAPVDSDINPCIALFRSDAHGNYFDMVNPIVLTDDAGIDGHLTYAEVSSLIYANVRDEVRWRPAELEVRYLSPQNNYRAEVLLLRGADVHTFMEGYELLQGRTYQTPPEKQQ